MSDLEGRMTDAEHRLDVVEADLGDISTARGHDVALLTALRQTQVEHSTVLAQQSGILAEHSATLAEHSATLARHSAMHAEHTRRFDQIDSALGTLTVGMHAIERLLTRLVEDETD
ncbi:hypothetical protein [Euzebya sp.]|uniref:hypothetical protein n=1 Tax=Euzebya sp. TaxID=1971409 RepID=UPI003515569C